MSRDFGLDGTRCGRSSARSSATLSGKTLLHLQCHFGLDTLSWGRLGATVTGVDFSSKAITLARHLSKEVDVPAKFVRSSIEDLPDNLGGTFDIVLHVVWRLALAGGLAAMGHGRRALREARGAPFCLSKPTRRCRSSRRRQCHRLAHAAIRISKALGRFEKSPKGLTRHRPPDRWKRRNGLTA